MEEYYAYYVYNNVACIINFKISGSLVYHPKLDCFMDDEYYVKSVDDVIAMAAFGNRRPYIKGYCFKYSFGVLISREEFERYRSEGVYVKKPENRIIEWP